MPDVFFDRVLAPGDLEVRSDGRTIFGLVAPFDQEARVSDGGRPYTEVFRKGAFARTINARADKVKLLVNHDRQRLPIGRSTHLEERNDGLYGEFRVSEIDMGNQALELVRDNVLDSFSVGFSPVQHRGSTSTVVERTEVALREASVVAFPAYTGAAIGGVRSQDFDPDALAEFLELAAERGVTDLRTLFTEPAAGTSVNGLATHQTIDPASATRRIASHHCALMARKIREELNS